MYNGVKVYCPKCKSEDVEIRDATKLPDPERVSIDQLPHKDSGMMDLVMRYRTKKAVCKGCGYEKSWTEPR